MTRYSIINVEVQNCLNDSELRLLRKILSNRSYHAKIVINSNPSVSREASKDMIEQYNIELMNLLNI